MTIFKNRWFWLCLPLLVIVLALSVSDTARRYTFYGPALIASAGAKLACSGVYLMGRTPEEVIRRDVNKFDPAMKLASFQFDDVHQIASATVLGIIERSALYRPGIGCTLMVDTTVEQLLIQAEGIEVARQSPRPQAWPEGDVVTLPRRGKNIDWQQLDQGIDDAFEDLTENKTVDTRAVLVVHDGKIIAERYADGFDNKSRFLSWSASKSITSALIGTLVTDGKLALHAPAPVVEWALKDDPRHAISLHHLLTMTTGLEFSENYIPGNDSTEMLFSQAQMGGYAANKPLAFPPGTLWAYSSGTTNILSRILFDTTGGNLKSVHDYAWQRFFKPLGMTSAVFEPDVRGAFVGSSYFHATAQDWARFGLLYLNRGRVGDQQLLSGDWVSYSHTPTPLAPQGKYGAQFWLNAGNPSRDEGLMMPNLPKDTYMAMGFNDENIVIVPSKNAVVIRLGWSTSGTRFDTNRHFSAILAALPDTMPETI